jgi:hypothetical protein
MHTTGLVLVNHSLAETGMHVGDRSPPLVPVLCFHTGLDAHAFAKGFQPFFECAEGIAMDLNNCSAGGGGGGAAGAGIWYRAYPVAFVTDQDYALMNALSSLANKMRCAAAREPRVGRLCLLVG